ncbi:EAL domain-containing protein [Aneurinibacillus thermoaerophilus]|uniref:EAL domain-containing protein n=1 Tax=Aneurinibacillus thermoaerophilus TaxID=143495 RepID=A0ABX8YCP2_ANETH|nr:EAL domain-containing protein [Aneurinibacillus thermoaerophilus]QYY43226.1 EAL domain-containing protein [Aneurinibacillus thermoaerophilus]
MDNIKFSEKDLDTILSKKMFYHLYQPLYNLSNWKIYGYEAFFRTEQVNNPELFFLLAKKYQKLYELDILSIFHAIATYWRKRKGFESKLFINIFPSTIIHPEFTRFLNEVTSIFTFKTKNIVFEINEQEEITDFSLIKKAICSLKEQGFQIALDDVGKGFYSLRHLIELEPDFIKLDKYFSHNLSNCEKKQNLIKSLIDYCNEEIVLILEGIEKAEDLAIAKVLHVPIVQGYLLDKPSIL